MKKIGLLLSLLLMVSACSQGMKEKLGLVKQTPNEFLVTTRPPLTLPPDYNLRPVSDIAKGSEGQNLDSSERAFLKKMDAQDSNSDTKEAIDKELKNLND